MSAQHGLRGGGPRKRGLFWALGGFALVALSVSLLASKATLPRADFTFANGAEPSSLDTTQTTGVPEARLLRALFEGLCVLDPKTCQPLPGMAESWTISPDELTYTFFVRAGSRWTNGDEVTAFDFRDGFERLLDPREAAEYAYLLFAVRGARAFATEVDEHGAPRHSFDSVGVRASDARTLVVELDSPVPWFLYLAAYPPLAPLNRRALDSMRTRFPDTWRIERLRTQNIVTNGPWRVLERRVNDRIRLAKHDAYWDQDNVAFETLDVLASEHLTTNVNLYLTGEIGFVNEVPALVVPRLTGRADWKPTPYLATYFYRLNVTRPPLDDPRVRRALALAIDRRAITSGVTRAGEPPLFSFVPAAMRDVTGYEPPSFRGTSALDGEVFARDVLEARRLLVEAGFSAEKPPMRRLEIHYNTQSTNRDVAELVAHEWKTHLGIDVRLVNQEKKVALDTQRRLDYDVSRSTWIADYPDPSSFLEVMTSTGANNRTGFEDAEYDALLARAATSRGTERERLYRAAEERLLAALPIIPLFGFTTTSLVDPALEGFHPNALDIHFPKFWRRAHVGDEPR
ncbi:MAG: peptide ABC transporter substrate-binding protein [Planctomycetota bacterium]|nr:peptide ABC transporter substrate-binding protein [Planctomycetota bacterium]